MSETRTIVIDAMGATSRRARPSPAPSWRRAGRRRRGHPRRRPGPPSKRSLPSTTPRGCPSPSSLPKGHRRGEQPALALRSKPRASIAVAAGLLKAGKADALVSAGSTGGTMAASVLALGLFPGLERPTLGGPFLALAPHTTIIDLGANVDAKPSQLLSFGALGSSFARFFFGTETRAVALLSVGSEEGRGTSRSRTPTPCSKQAASTSWATSRARAVRG